MGTQLTPHPPIYASFYRDIQEGFRGALNNITRQPLGRLYRGSFEENLPQESLELFDAALLKLPDAFFEEMHFSMRYFDRDAKLSPSAGRRRKAPYPQ